MPKISWVGGVRSRSRITIGMIRTTMERAPVVFVFGAAVLDVLQKRIELQRNLAYFVAVGVGLLRVHVVNAADRRDDSCRTASAALLESREFVHRNMTLLDLQTQVLSQLTEALVSDRRKYGVRLRRR